MADESPLAEASPTSLATLFSLDPLQMARSDIDQIVAELRAARERWNVEEAAGKKSASKPKKMVGKKPTLSLDDLGL